MTSRKYREYLYCPLTQVITYILAKAKESENFSNFQESSLIENNVLGCAYYFFYINRLISILLKKRSFFNTMNFAVTKNFFELSGH